MAPKKTSRRRKINSRKLARVLKVGLARRGLFYSSVAKVCQEYIDARSCQGRYWYDWYEADRVVRFFETQLILIEGEWAGRPFLLEDWQKRHLRQVFGWKRQDGSRRYRYWFLAIPRKNAKSTLCAGIALYLLYADGEPGAQVYSAAGDSDQAKVVFRIAKAMMMANKKMRSLGKPLYAQIDLPSVNSFYKAISAEAYTKHGMNAHGIVMDELHVQPNRELFDTLTTSTGSRRQPLTVVITTAGDNVKSFCYEEWEHALRVASGEEKDESMYVAIYAADKNDDWRNPAVWRKSNPNFGISIKEDYFQQEVQKAINTPSYLNTFKRLHLNIWTEAATAWITKDAWDACGVDVREEDLVGLPCFAGFDLSTVRDLTAFVLCFQYRDGYLLVPRFWIPLHGIAERSRNDKVSYALWKDQGHILTTTGDTIVKEEVAARVLDECTRFKCKEMIIDQWGLDQKGETVQYWLKNGINVGTFKQGFANFKEPTLEFERLVLQKKLYHNKNPILAWNVSCATLEQDSMGNSRPVKPDRLKSSKRIDGVVASIMALARARAVPENKQSVYATRGALVFEF